MDDVYFFDTYALIEVIRGNHRYEPYKNAAIFVTIFNIVELHYALLREFSSITAEEYAGKYIPFQVTISLDIIKEANALKLHLRKRELSAADVIGYATAQKLGIKFLTGDEDFEDLAGVEYIKK